MDSKSHKTVSKIREQLQRNKKYVAAWSAFFAVVLFVYHLLSDGDFSFLLTFGSICQTFAFFLLVFKIVSQKRVKGISLKTLELYALVYAFRLFSILRFQGYLPFDSSGDWFYQFVEICSLVLCCGSIWLIVAKYKHDYEQKNDMFGALYIPTEFGIVYLVVPCFFLAMLFHPRLNDNFLADVSWTTAQYLESVAVVPQLFMFTKGEREVEDLISHWVYALGFGRLLHMWFWMSSFHELSDKGAGSIVGILVIFTQLLHMLIMGDFFYYYIKSLKSGGPMMLPTSINRV